MLDIYVGSVGVWQLCIYAYSRSQANEYVSCSQPLGIDVTGGRMRSDDSRSVFIQCVQYTWYTHVHMLIRFSC